MSKRSWQDERLARMSDNKRPKRVKPPPIASDAQIPVLFDLGYFTTTMSELAVYFVETIMFGQLWRTLFLWELAKTCTFWNRLIKERIVKFYTAELETYRSIFASWDITQPFPFPDPSKHRIYFPYQFEQSFPFDGIYGNKRVTAALNSILVTPPTYCALFRCFVVHKYGICVRPKKGELPDAISFLVSPRSEMTTQQFYTITRRSLCHQIPDVHTRFAFVYLSLSRVLRDNSQCNSYPHDLAEIHLTSWLLFTKNILFDWVNYHGDVHPPVLLTDVGTVVDGYIIKSVLEKSVVELLLRYWFTPPIVIPRPYRFFTRESPTDFAVEWFSQCFNHNPCIAHVHDFFANE